jgi:preprotein translocase subunit SecA
VSYSGGAAQSGAAAINAAATGAAMGTAGSAAALGSNGGPAEPHDAMALAGPAMEPVQQRVVDAEQQTGRNDPCWCGSNKKFKKCHGA